MSWDLGWNAQAALLPQQVVKIKVSDKGNQKLKAAMMAIQQKTKGQSLSVKGQYVNIQKPSLKQVKRNKGIEERSQKDQQAKLMQSLQSDKSFQQIRFHLQKKQQTYLKLQKTPQNHPLFNVDFQQKQLVKQDEEYQRLKTQFYSGRLNEIMQQQKEIHQSQEKAGVHDHMREKLAWEREVLQELKGEFVGEQKGKVAQSFDRKLTEDEKRALEKVIRERLREKQRMEELNKKRDEEVVQKRRKLQKLDLLGDSDQQQAQRK